MTPVDVDPQIVGHGWRLARAFLNPDTFQPELRPVFLHGRRSLAEGWLAAECESASELRAAERLDVQMAVATRRPSEYWRRTARVRFLAEPHDSPDPRCVCGWHFYPSLRTLSAGVRQAPRDDLVVLTTGTDIVVVRVAYGGAIAGPAVQPSAMTRLSYAVSHDTAFAELIRRRSERVDRSAPLAAERHVVRAQFIRHVGPLYVGAGVMNVGSPWRRGLQERYRIVQAHGPLIPAVRSGQILTDMAAAGWSDSSGRRL